MSSASYASDVEIKDNLDAKIYDEKGVQFVDLFIKKVARVSSLLKIVAVTKFMNLEGLCGRNILDTGCGSGYWCYQAAKFGAKSVSGFDIQEKMVQAAKKLTAQFTQVSVCVGSVQSMPYGDNTFDIAFSLWPTNRGISEVL